MGHSVPEHNLQNIVDAKKRPYNYYGKHNNRVFVKKSSRDSWIKVTQWNSECEKTVYAYNRLKGWRKVQDRASIHEWINVDWSADVVVIVHCNQLITPTGSKWEGGRPPSVAQTWRRIFTHKQRKA